MAGKVYWMRALKHHLDAPVEVLQKAYFMRDSHVCKQIFSDYSQVGQDLEEMERRHFSEWSLNLGRQCFKKLEQPLMVRSKDKIPMLDVNFDKIQQSPQTLKELGERIKLLETLQGNLAKTEAQIPVIHEQFAILDKYEVPVQQAYTEHRVGLEADCRDPQPTGDA